MKSGGSGGKRASAEARRYVYSVLSGAVASDLEDDGGWLLGGITNESDRRSVLMAAREIIVELRRKGAGPRLRAGSICRFGEARTAREREVAAAPLVEDGLGEPMAWYVAGVRFRSLDEVPSGAVRDLADWWTGSLHGVLSRLEDAGLVDLDSEIPFTPLGVEVMRRTGLLIEVLPDCR